jgi:CBS domain-containing protein
MATVNDLIKARTHFYQAEAGQTVLEVVRLMVEKNIGAVPVVRNGELAGIFSERDLMKRVVAENRNPQKTRVEEVMTADPQVVSPDADLSHCLALMRQHGFRHLPVCEGKKVKALLSLRDILLHTVVEKDGEVQMMRAYITQS